MAISDAAKRETVLQYYRASDSGRFPAELFTSDFQFFVPKYGVGRGIVAFMEFAMSAGVKKVTHHLDDIILIVDGDLVAVEGTTEGVTSDDFEWAGGKTPAGRFASVFSFDSKGLIERMHIYLDPDFTGRDKAGFRWKRGADQQW